MLVVILVTDEFANIRLLAVFDSRVCYSAWVEFEPYAYDSISFTLSLGLAICMLIVVCLHSIGLQV